MPLSLSTVGVGTVAGDGTGDTAREGGIKINDNFSAIQTLVNANETALSGKLANVVEDTTPELGGNLAAGGYNVTNLGDVTFKTGAAGGTLRTGTSAADKFQLQAYDVDGAAYVTLIEADAGNTPRLQLLADHLDIEDATDTTKIAKFDASGITTGTSRTFTFPDASGTFLLNVADDATPQLGASLDVNGQKIVSTSNGNIDIEPNGTGNVLLGNFTFDADQTVGAGQDNYVLTYDNASGLISLEAAAGGGSSAASDLTWSGGTQSEVADGASAVAFNFDTDAAYSTSGAKLLSLKNNAGEKFSVDKDGVISPGVGTGNLSNSGSSIIASAAFITNGNTHTGANLSASELAWGRDVEQNVTILKRAQNSDLTTYDLLITGQNAFATATTNLDGGDIIITAGGGASSSAGDADGGNVYLRGGTGYGTGSTGLIIMDNLPTSDPGVAGALWSNSNVLTVSTG